MVYQSTIVLQEKFLIVHVKKSLNKLSLSYQGSSAQYVNYSMIYKIKLTILTPELADEGFAESVALPPGLDGFDAGFLAGAASFFVPSVLVVPADAGLLAALIGTALTSAFSAHSFTFKDNTGC